MKASKIWDTLRYGLNYGLERYNRDNITASRTRGLLPSYKVKTGTRKIFVPKRNPVRAKEREYLEDLMEGDTMEIPDYDEMGMLDPVTKDRKGYAYVTKEGLPTAVFKAHTVPVEKYLRRGRRSGGKRKKWSELDDFALAGAYRQNLKDMRQAIDDKKRKLQERFDYDKTLSVEELGKISKELEELDEQRAKLPALVWDKVLKRVATSAEEPIYRDEGTKSVELADALSKLRAKSARAATAVHHNTTEAERNKFLALSPEEQMDYERDNVFALREDDALKRMRADEQVYQLLKLPGLHTLSPEEYELTLFAGKLANLAYTSDEDVTKTINTLRNVHYFHDMTRAPLPTIEGFIAYDQVKKIICLSFKGTDNYQDAMTDANTFKFGELVEFNGERLPVPLDGHEGFIQRFLNISSDVIQTLSGYFIVGTEGKLAEGQKLLITGHSLGGALATVAAFIIGQLTSVYIQLITFEAPRVFTTETVKNLMAYPPTAAIEKRQIRVSSRGDVVPGVPPAAAGFMHTGRNFYFNKSYGWGKKGSQALLTHSMANVFQSLLDYGQLNTPEEKSDLLWLTQGRGVVKKRKGLKRGSAAAKARMAYVRSFKK